MTTNDRISRRRSRHAAGPRPAEEVLPRWKGYNGRLDTIQAGILKIKLGRMDEWTELRRERRRGGYQGAIGGPGWTRFVLPFQPAGTRPRASPFRGSRSRAGRSDEAPGVGTTSARAFTIRFRCICRTPTSGWDIIEATPGDRASVGGGSLAAYVPRV